MFGRRTFVPACLVLAGMFLAACAVQSSPETKAVPSKDQLIFMDPASVDVEPLPVDAVSALNTTGTPQDVAVGSWRLEVQGKVANPLSLSYQDLQAMPKVRKKELLICPGVFVDVAVWEGVPLAALLEKTVPAQDYQSITFFSLDGYSQRFSREEAEQHLLFLALTVNDVPLPKAHGFPARLVADKLYGGRWVKWLSRIQLD